MNERTIMHQRMGADKSQSPWLIAWQIVSKRTW